jgi:hypothetical protein
MEWIRQIREVERLRGTDSTRQWMNRVRVPSADTVAYIQHMQYMETHYPLLSIFDLYLLKESWMAGREYGIHIGRSQNQGDSVPSGNDTSATGKDAQ